MIPNVTKGASIKSLMRYLQGPGRANEHTNPHVVAGDGFVVGWYGAEQLDAESAAEIADYIDAPRVHFGTVTTERVTAQDPETGAMVVMGRREVNVWHCAGLVLRCLFNPMPTDRRGEIPPGMLGFLDDAWQRFVGNMGVTGPDKGKGGKYLVLPPGYTGKVPQGYFLLKPPTNRNFLFLRGSIKNGLKPAVENITSKLKVYPLKDAAKPTPTEFVDMSGKAFNTVFPSDFSYFENLNQIVQEEPIDAISPEVRGAIAAIGIVKGQPLAPDARMKKLLTEAALLGNATSRSITYYPRFAGVKIYPDDPKSVWSTAFANKNTSFEANGAMGLDARVLYYFNAGGVTPAMAATRAGEGSDYALAVLDANQQAFDGSKAYKLHLPPNVPVNDFWAVTIYDTQTRSQLQTGQKFPTIGSQTEGMKKNADGSYDVYFAPKAPKGMEGNWLQTVPGKSWFTILRMYGPLQPWIDKTWRPSEIELVK